MIDSARGYALTLAELLTHIPDGHVTLLGSRELRDFLGEASPPFVGRLVDGMLAVTHYKDAEAAKAENVSIGDVILTIDGEPIEERMKRYGKYLTASTTDAQKARVANVVLNGAEGPSTLTLKDQSGRVKQISTNRKKQFRSVVPQRTGDAIQILSGKIGYVDLQKLLLTQVESMFEVLKDTRGLVFDIRGYPQGTIWLVAPQLAQKDHVLAALFRRPLVSPDERQLKTFGFAQFIEVNNGPKYKGKTVALIDDRTISQGEHSALFLQAANGTKLIGSRSAGANGDVTYVSIPGNMTVYFTGQEVLFPDGRQLQRIGLIPDVEARPTLAGIRAGKDEVLESALQFLESL